MFMSSPRCAFLLSWCFAPLSLFAVEIIAHRGASFDAPENTLSSMKLAWEQKADAVELDLWLSRDGEIIVFHDSDTKRFEQPARKIPSLTWRETQVLDVGNWKSPKFKDERIPTLESILATIPPGKRAVLEIKCGPEIVPELERVLRASGRPLEQLAVISFNFDTLVESKRMFPSVPHLFLYDYKKDAQTGEFPDHRALIARAKAARLDGLNLQFRWPITESFVKEVKDAGLQLFVWTVNDPVVAKRLVDAGVDGITTDRPQWLREQLK
jgi:glycerophosphoryl diester phosphodiesterase